MRTQQRAAALGVVVTAATTTSTGWLCRLAAGQWPGWGRVPLDGATAFLATAVAAGLATWVSLVVALATAPLLRPAGSVRSAARDLPAHGTAAGRPTGGPVTRVTAVLLAAAALSLGSSAAHAGPAVSGSSQVRVHEPIGPGAPSPDGAVHRTDVSAGSSPTAGPAAPVPGWTPTPEPTGGNGPTVEHPPAPVGLVSPSGDRAATHRRVEDHHVVVHRGDTLWSIAARHLGRQATDADVADAWPRWYAANRDVIGDDPDHILPGQVLVAPAGAAR